MTDIPEYCTICYDEMNNIIEDVWMCQGEDPHFFQCIVHWGWNTFEEINFVPAGLAGRLAQALLAERKRAGKLQAMLGQAMYFWEYANAELT